MPAPGQSARGDLTRTGASVVAISVDVPGQRSSAPSSAPQGHGSPQEELQLGRLEALLVNRSADTSWWDALAQQVVQVTNCFLPHLAGDRLDVDASAQHSTAERSTFPQVARLESEHRYLLDELIELRSLVEGSARSQGSVSRALAASTEVIALLRGHNRRHRSGAFDAGSVDSVAST